jgi:hypothetical protein
LKDIQQEWTLATIPDQLATIETYWNKINNLGGNWEACKEPLTMRNGDNLMCEEAASLANALLDN